jgi:hypothetical protein
MYTNEAPQALDLTGLVAGETVAGLEASIDVKTRAVRRG